MSGKPAKTKPKRATNSGRKHTDNFKEVAVFGINTGSNISWNRGTAIIIKFIPKGEASKAAFALTALHNVEIDHYPDFKDRLTVGFHPDNKTGKSCVRDLKFVEALVDLSFPLYQLRHLVAVRLKHNAEVLKHALDESKIDDGKALDKLSKAGPIVVAGFGATDRNSPIGVGCKRFGKLTTVWHSKIIPHGEEIKFEHDFGFRLKEEFIAGGGAITCNGDSGAPIYDTDGANRILLGIYIRETKKLVDSSGVGGNICGKGAVIERSNVIRYFIDALK